MESAAILTPYTGQVRLITNMLRQQGLEQARPGAPVFHPAHACCASRAWSRRVPGPQCLTLPMHVVPAGPGAGASRGPSV